MKPGPKPKPTRLKILEGNPSGRPLPIGEPQPEPGAPRCPKRYNAEARKMWHALSKQLVDCGIMTKIDGLGFELLVDALLAYRTAAAQLAKTGPVWLEAGEGKIPKFAYSPYWVQANKAAKSLTSMLREFGMTPSARSSIKACSPFINTGDSPSIKYFS